MIQLLKLHDFQKMPWKNGLGFTLEIARKPSAETDDFDWRVSMADVENDGEFSYFSGKKAHYFHTERHRDAAQYCRSAAC